MLVAPLTSGDEVRGRISLQNLDRTNAFTENDVRLLTTLAGSLSVALENARLVHETRQRNAELALINGVQDAMGAEPIRRRCSGAGETGSGRSSTRRLSRSGLSTRRPGSCITRTSSNAVSGIRWGRDLRPDSASTCSRPESR